jgi:hypothetical protein
MNTDAAPYAGRTVDLAAYAEGPPGTPLVASLAGDAGPGAVVTGVLKLSQRFLMELLTAAGSMTYLPARGCNLVADAASGRWRTVADVGQSYYAALVDVRRTLRGEETDADPDDERFESAPLLGVTLTPGGVDLRIAVTSRAGAARVVVQPLNLTV